MIFMLCACSYSNVFSLFFPAGDLGGYLGLLLGASVVTVCEILDLIIYNIAKFHQDKKEKKEKQKQNEKPRIPSASKWKAPNKVDVFPMEKYEVNS